MGSVVGRMGSVLGVMGCVLGRMSSVLRGMYSVLGVTGSVLGGMGRDPPTHRLPPPPSIHTHCTLYTFPSRGAAQLEAQVPQARQGAPRGASACLRWRWRPRIEEGGVEMHDFPVGLANHHAGAAAAHH